MSFDAGAATSQLGLNVQPFRQGMLEATAIAQTFPPVVTAFLANPLLGVAALAGTVGGAIARGLGSAIGTGVKLAGDMEAAKISFEVMLGSADKAGAMLKDIKAYAAATPFEMPGLVATGKQFLAFGMDAAKVMPTLKALGDVAALSDVPMQDLGLIYAQVMSKTKLQTEELLQFAERGVPLRRELERMTGLKGAAFDAKVTAGGIGFGMVETAFQNLTGKGGQFEDGAAKASKGIKGLISTFNDAKASLNQGFGEGFAKGLGLQEVITTATEALANIEGVATSFGEHLGSALRPIVMETLGWIRDHPEEAQAKVTAAAGAIVNAVTGVADAIKAVIPVAMFALNNLKEIGIGAVGGAAIKMLLGVASSYMQVAMAMKAVGAAQGGIAAAGGLGGGLAPAAAGAARGGLGMLGKVGIGAAAGFGVGAAAAGLGASSGLSNSLGAGVGLGATIGMFAGGPLGALLGALIGGGAGYFFGAGEDAFAGGAAVPAAAGGGGNRTITIKVGPDTDVASLSRQILAKSQTELEAYLRWKQQSGDFIAMTQEGL